MWCEIGPSSHVLVSTFDEQIASQLASSGSCTPPVTRSKTLALPSADVLLRVSIASMPSRQSAMFGPYVGSPVLGKLVLQTARDVSTKRKPE
jgi:hypothetical protein